MMSCLVDSILTQQRSNSEINPNDVGTAKTDKVTVSEVARVPTEEVAAPRSGKDEKQKKDKHQFWRRVSDFAESAATGGVNKPDKYGMYPI